MACKFIYNKQGEKIGVEDQDGQPSQLFQEILNNPHMKNFDEAVQIYANTYSDKLQFPRVADKLPLTLPVFDLRQFVELKGKQVNPTTVQQMLNGTGIKQIEKDLINQAIEENYKGQNKISYDELEATVRANIMPLERITTSSYADYGMDNLGNGSYGEAKTIIFNAPIEHGVTGHFTNDFKASKRQNIKYQAKQLNDNTWVAVEEGYQSQANDNNIYEFVGTAGTKEVVDTWIKEYNDKNKFANSAYIVYEDIFNETRDYNRNIKPVEGFSTKEEAEKYIKENGEKYNGNLDYLPQSDYNSTLQATTINKGMFGHIRVWENKERDQSIREESAKFDAEMLNKYGENWRERLNQEEKKKALEYINKKRDEVNIFYVAELQSDYYQKNNAKKELLKEDEEAWKILKERGRISTSENLDLAQKKHFPDFAVDRVQVVSIEDLPKWGAENLLSDDRIEKMKERANVDADRPYLVFDVSYSKTDPVDFFKTKEEAAELKEISDTRSLQNGTPLQHIPLSKKEEYKTVVENTAKTIRAELEKDINKRLEKAYDEAYKNLLPQEKQFIASQKIWEQRMVREAIKEATLSGATSLRFPTPYTLSVIEGYVSSEEGKRPYEIITSKNEDELQPGDVVRFLEEEHLIINADEESVTAIRYEEIQEILSPEEFKDRTEIDPVQNLKTKFVSKNMADAIEEVAKHNLLVNERSTIIDNFLKEPGITEARMREGLKDIEGRLKDSYENLSENVGKSSINANVKIANSFAMETFKNIQYIYDTNEERVYIFSGDLTYERLGQPSTYKEGDKANFDISQLSDVQQTVANKYVEIAQILEKEKPTEIVTDENGFDWYEAKITESDAQSPVVAFSLRTQEPNLTYKTPEGNSYGTYAEALRNTDQGDVSVGVNTLDGFKELFSINSNTSTNTYNGLLNNLIKSKLLSGETYVDNKGRTIHKVEGNSLEKRLINTELSKREAKRHVGRAVKALENGDIYFDTTKVDGQVAITKKNGETEYTTIKDLNSKSFEELNKQYEDAIGVLAARELKDAKKTYTEETEQAAQIVPENELQKKLLELLKKMGIKTLDLENYVNNYTKKNGIPPNAQALADLGQRIIAFKDGLISAADLNEEMSHFIVASTPTAETENLLRNIHKTQEWAEFSQMYRDIYGQALKGESLEAAVREEILGKVLANALQRNFEQREGATETEQNIVNRLLDILNRFFERITAYFKPGFQTELNDYTDSIFANLMQDNLFNKLDMSKIENRQATLFSINPNDRSSINELFRKTGEALSIINAQQQQLSKRGGQSSARTVLAKSRELLAEEEELQKVRALSNITAIAKKQVEQLERAADKKKNGEFPFSQEENAVYETFSNVTSQLLSEVKALVNQQEQNNPEYKIIIQQIDETTKKYSDLKGKVGINENKAIQTLVDRVAIKHNLTDAQKANLEKAIEASQKDSNVLHSYLGSLINARSPLLNIAGDIISEVTLNSRTYFLQNGKPFVQKLEDLKVTPTELKTFKNGRYLINDIDNVELDKFTIEVERRVYNAISEKSLTTEDYLKAPKLEGENLDIFRKEVKNIMSEVQEQFFTEDYIKKQDSLFKDIDSASISYHKRDRSERSEIRVRATKDGITTYDANDKADLEALNRVRAQAMNFYNASGKLKLGLRENNEGEIELDYSTIENYIEETAEGRLAYGLSKISEVIREQFVGKEQETELPQKFVEQFNSYSTTEEKLDFLFLNAYVGFSDEFWQNFGQSETMFEKLRNAKDGENDEDIDDVIQEIRTAQQKIAYIQKANRVYNRPSETNVNNMSRAEKEIIKSASEDLEDAFQKANALLPKEEYEEIERLFDTKPNEAFTEEIEDLGIESLDEQLEFIKKHTTRRNGKIIDKAEQGAKDLQKGLISEVPFSMRKFFTVGMSQEESNQALLEMAQSKLLPYYKRTEPQGFTETLDDLKAGGSLEDFVNSGLVKVNPNFSFYENSSNENVNQQFLDNKAEGRLQIKKGDIQLKNPLFKGETVNFDDNKFVEIKNNSKKHETWKAIVELQKQTLDNYGITDTHNIFKLPQIGKRGFRQNQDLVQKWSDPKVWKEAIKDTLQFRNDEAELGQDEAGNATTKILNNNVIPIYYTKDLENEDDLSDELLYSYMLMNQQSALFKSRNEQLGNMLSVKKAILDTQFENKSAEASNTYRQFKSFTDYNFYGVKENLQYSINVLGLVKVDVAKVLRGFIKFSSLVNLGGLTIPFTNLIQSTVNKTVESIVGEKVNLIGSKLGNAEFLNLAPASMGEMLEINSKSKLNVLMEQYGLTDVVSERYKNSNYTKYTRGLGKLPHITATLANFPTLPRTMLSVLMDNRYYNGKIMNLSQFKQYQNVKGIKDIKQVETEWKKLDLFYEDIHTEKGVFSVDEDKAGEKLGIRGEELKEYLSKIQAAIGSRVRVAVSDVDYAINPEEKSILARNSLSNLILQHSGWLLVAGAKRLKSKHFSFATGLVEEGSYLTLGRFIKDITTGASKKNGASYLQHVKNVWNGELLKDKDGNIDLDALESQRKNLIRTGVDIAVVNILFLMGVLLANLRGDDEPEDFLDELGDLAIYFNYRAFNEVTSSSIALPAQFIAKVKSPVVSLSTMGETAKFYKLFTGDEIIERGKFAGETERFKTAVKLIPFLKDYFRLTNVKKETVSYKHFNESSEDFVALSYLLNQEEK